MKAITGIDLPYGSPGGSVELLRDLYLGPSPKVLSDVFMLAPVSGGAVAAAGRPTILSVDGKALDGGDFWSYRDRLAVAIRERFAADAYDVVHLQHLTFGATSALQRAFPDPPRIAIVHGTDLLFAESHATQADVLHHTATSANAVVVPTLAMADRLARFVDVPTERLVHIPWGVPDELLATIGERSPAPGDRLRILYAGRLTSEKAAVSILRVVAGPDGVELSVAAPPAEYARLSETSNLSEVRYLGWFTRPQLWREFARHDLLIVPSLALEAFGLVAVEAQACGLPVAFHGVPGLTEVMADSGFCVNFHDTAEVIALLRRLRESPALLDEAREAGWANSRRFPLSATAAGLNELSAALTTSRSLS